MLWLQSKHNYLNTTVNKETFCLQQVTNGAVWGLTFLSILSQEQLPIHTVSDNALSGTI